MTRGNEWTLDPARGLPADSATRAHALEIFRHTQHLPLVSMHGHVEADLFLRNETFGNPAELLIIPDHYLVRMLVSQGHSHAELGVPSKDGSVVESDPRAIWRLFCRNWKLFRGTPTRFWLEHELAIVFGATTAPSEETADALYDELQASLNTEAFRPRSILERFKVEILATTDPAISDLAAHHKLAQLPGNHTIVPTFRPDSLLHVRNSQWQKEIRTLSQVSGVEVGDYSTFLAALRQRRTAFIAAGARATDHGHLSADTTPLPPADAQRIFAAALTGTATAREAEAFAANMIFEMARMSTEDGLVMQLHPGVLRNHNANVLGTYGPDTGFDIPVKMEFTRALAPMLDAFGMNPDFRVIAFTTDETVYSRELAPLAGAYPAMRLGAPWWFLDSPEQMRRFRESAVETAGFYNTSGFVDDTRALASVPARHDLSRRIDAGYLARLVAEGRLGLDEGIETAIDLAYNLPLQSYAART
ncbi:glucuronate isomerase [Arthrobacter dokdonensis]|uniref:glucuronate isomerase n=1 Tax=Arthrobacter dokdonellae TaxID=2211210 RepID=UPI000DE5BFCE|nr:glucuronate isomerase [Arthrobacter dokdonellae]